MRLDLYLKSSRLIIRRSAAQQFCDAGKIIVNGVTAKSSKIVKAGDIVEIHRPQIILSVKITEIPTKNQVPKEAARELYEIVSSTKVSDEF